MLPPACPAKDMSLAIKKEGFLTKKAVRTLHKDNWKKRYVVLTEDGLLGYYKAKGDKKPKFSFHLTDMSTAEEVVDHGKANEFLIRTEDFSFFACADTEAESQAWVKAAGEVIAAIREKRNPSKFTTGAVSAAAPAAAAGGAGAKPAAGAAPAAAAAGTAAGASGAAGAKGGNALPPPPAAGGSSGTASAGAKPAAAGGAGSLPPPPSAAGTGGLPPPPAAGGAGAAAGIKSLSDLIKTAQERIAKAVSIGANDLGQLGLGHTNTSGVSSQEHISALKVKMQPVYLSAGHRHGAAITCSDQLFVWGEGISGEGDKGRGGQRDRMHYCVGSEKGADQR